MCIKACRSFILPVKIDRKTSTMRRIDEATSNVETDCSNNSLDGGLLLHACDEY